METLPALNDSLWGESTPRHGAETLSALLALCEGIHRRIPSQKRNEERWLLFD